jgi:hypothetical protein
VSERSLRGKLRDQVASPNHHFPSSCCATTYGGVRIYIFQFEIENEKFIVYTCGPFFSFVVAEVSGLVVAPTHVSLTSLNEVAYLKIMQEKKKWCRWIK